MNDTDDIYSTSQDNDTDNPLEEVNTPLAVGETPVTYATPQINDALRRYLSIQREMKKLEDERLSLRDIIARHMHTQQKTLWNTKVDEADVGVRCIPQTVITYDEHVLRERLGNRYTEILDVDIKKVKEHLAEATPLLAPILGLIGTPSREKVRDAIEQKRLDVHLFDGAYTKTETQRFAVTSGKK